MFNCHYNITPDRLYLIFKNMQAAFSKIETSAEGSKRALALQCQNNSNVFDNVL